MITTAIVKNVDKKAVKKAIRKYERFIENDNNLDIHVKNVQVDYEFGIISANITIEGITANREYPLQDFA